jgi:hypothetical protein
MTFTFEEIQPRAPVGDIATRNIFHFRNRITTVFLVKKEYEGQLVVNQNNNSLQKQFSELQVRDQPPLHGHEVQPPAVSGEPQLATSEPPTATNVPNVVSQEIFSTHQMKRYDFALVRRTVPPDIVGSLVIMKEYERI